MPYPVRTVLTIDNGLQFTDLRRIRDGRTARSRVHPFLEVCRTNGIEHRLTKPYDRWTNEQVERMNRTLKEARSIVTTTKRMTSCEVTWMTLLPPKFGRRLKTLKASRHTSTSAKPGSSSRTASPQSDP